MKKQRYAPHGSLALDPKAFGQIFDLPEACAPVLEAEVGVAIVEVRGPLMHRREYFFDSYEAIKGRVAEAIALGPRRVLLSIDSPGGLVSGAFDTAREIRAMAEAAGVELHAHVAGMAASAAYALASSASRITVSESAMIGSIGVIDTMVDTTEANASMGVNVQLVTSGDRKSDGNPNVAISADALAATQTRVDDLAQMFFALVSDHDWGGSAGSVEGLQAALMTGADAVRLGLATDVGTFAQALTLEDSPGSPSAAETDKGNETMEKEAVANLRKMARSEDEEESKRAKAALAALGAEEDDDEGGGDEDAKAKAEEEEAAKAKAEEEEEEAKAKAEEEEEEEAKAKAVAAAASGDASALALQALTEVHELKAARASDKREDERSKLLASRPDFAPELVEVLKTAPMATVRKTVKTLKRGPGRAASVAAAATATATVRGEEQGAGTASRLPADEKSALDVAMGLSEMSTKTVHTGNKMSFGVRTPIAQKGSDPQ